MTAKKTTMTPDDIATGRLLADHVVAMATKLRPPAAVSGVALALAAVAHLAECGSQTAREMFERSYEDLGREMEARDEAEKASKL